MTRVTLVFGQDALSREKAISKALAKEQRNDSVAVILEGAPPENPIVFDALVSVMRIAPGCPCCTGKLTMRVMLNRALQRSPDCLYIGLANIAHIKEFRDFLMQPPYGELLNLTNDIRLPDVS